MLPDERSDQEPDGWDAPVTTAGGLDQCTVAGRVILGLVRAVEQAGGSRARFAGASRLDLAQLQHWDARIDRDETDRLIELALDVTNDAALGLHWAEHLDQNTFAPVSHLMAHASTLRQALAAVERFSRLLSEDPGYVVVERGDEVLLRRPPRPRESLRVQRFVSEVTMVSLSRVLRGFSDGERPLRVSFDYPAPSYQTEYARVLGGPAHFEQPHCGLVFHRTLLDAPAPERDDELHATIQTLAERRLSRMAKQVSYALRVREFLVRKEWWRHRADMPTVAHALGVSARSLRRHLKRENTSYTAVTNEALAIAAKHLLREQRVIRKTARAMGFSDASSFHRAFKHWTGVTPSAYLAASGDEPER